MTLHHINGILLFFKDQFQLRSFIQICELKIHTQNKFKKQNKTAPQSGILSSHSDTFMMTRGVLN